MERITITNAVRGLETLLALLDNAYWEAAEIVHKDAIYDVISTLHMEINELAKLSIDDHSMAYEPITTDFRTGLYRLKLLQNNVADWVMRSKTAKALEEELPKVISFLRKQN